MKKFFTPGSTTGQETTITSTKGEKMCNTKGKLSRYILDFWKYRDLLKLLVTRDIKLKYRNSYLGVVSSLVKEEEISLDELKELIREVENANK